MSQQQVVKQRKDENSSQLSQSYAMVYSTQDRRSSLFLARILVLQTFCNMSYSTGANPEITFNTAIREGFLRSITEDWAIYLRCD